MNRWPGSPGSGTAVDGSWQDLVQARGNVASVTTHTIAPVKMRFVRLHITDSGPTDDPTARICEFEVYASDGATIRVKIGEPAAPSP